MEETQAVETEIQAAAPEQGVETIDSQAPEDQIDYAVELANVLERNAKLEADNENYKKGILKAKGKLPGEQPNISDLVKREVEKTVASQTITSTLQEMSSDAKEQELIMHYFNGMSADMGTIRERMENAKLIANKKAYMTKSREMQTALQNRSQLTPTFLGSSSDGAEIQSSVLTQEQINHYKSIGKSDAWIKLLEKNTMKNRASLM